MVDDEPGIQRIFERALNNYGYVTKVAGDGHQALAYLERERFDVVVTDVNMPGGDGITFLRMLRKRDATLPVIVMTGRPLDSVMTLAAQAGAFRYIVKPIMPSTLREVIESALARRAEAARPESPPDPERP